jgi:hypothetical protein
MYRKGKHNIKSRNELNYLECVNEHQFVPFESSLELLSYQGKLPKKNNIPLRENTTVIVQIFLTVILSILCNKNNQPIYESNNRRKFKKKSKAFYNKFQRKNASRKTRTRKFPPKFLQFSVRCFFVSIWLIKSFDCNFR